MADKIPCVICPESCIVTVKNGEVQDYKCFRGRDFALSEINNPVRVFTTTVKASDGRLVPVKSRGIVPKTEVVMRIKSLAQTGITDEVIVTDTPLCDF